MRVILETVAGPHVGKKILLRAGEFAKVGRTEWADFAFPNDGHMSSLHFSVHFEQTVCHVRDLESANGTLVNGAPVTQETLCDRDEIRAGQTTFAVRIEGGPPAAPRAEPRPAASRPLPDAAAAGATSSPPADRPEPTASPPPSEESCPKPAPVFQKALADDDPAVRSRALWAAAWSGETWLLDYCRHLCGRPSPDHWDAIVLTAILGTPDDLPRMLAVAGAEELGPRRFQSLGAYGHPAVIEPLLEAIAGDDPATAVAAGAAFTRITGREIDSDASGPGAPGEPVLSDPTRARAHWEQVRQEFSEGTRYASGHDLSRGADEETLRQLDPDWQREAHLRTLYEGA
ncbi:MAG: FHA domain-containing protein [Planctomycetota bacterium]|jgi:hypothetical protein